jgi:hypothetical protein
MMAIAMKKLGLPWAVRQIRVKVGENWARRDGPGGMKADEDSTSVWASFKE